MRRWLRSKKNDHINADALPWVVEVPEGDLVDGSYMVIHRDRRGDPGYQALPSGQAAVEHVADLYALHEVREAKIFVMREVPFTARPKYPEDRGTSVGE